MATNVYRVLVKIGLFKRYGRQSEFNKIVGIRATYTCNFPLLVVINLQEKTTQTIDRIEEVIIGKALDEISVISMEISYTKQEVVKSLLRKYNHIFVWRKEQLLGIDPEVAYHILDVKQSSEGQEELI